MDSQNEPEIFFIVTLKIYAAAKIKPMPEVLFLKPPTSHYNNKACHRRNLFNQPKRPNNNHS